MTSKKKLLLVSISYLVSENRKRLEDLAGFFEVTCVTSNPKGKEVFNRPAESFNQETEVKTECKLIYAKERPAKQKHTRFYYQGLKQVFREGDYDLILVENEPWGIYRWQTWRWKKKYCPKALFGEFSWENFERKGIKGIILRQIYRLAVATQDFVVCGSQATKQIWKKAGQVEENILVAPQIGVDLEHFFAVDSDQQKQLRLSQSLPEKEWIVGYCGRLVSEKGIEDLIEAMRLIHQKLPQAPICLALMGDGVLRSQLQKMANEVTWLKILPPRPHFEVDQFLKALDLFVLPSRMSQLWQEQFGHVLIESMACKILTLGANTGAIPEVISKAEFVFEPNSPRELADKIWHYYEQLEDREKAATWQYEYVKTHFSHQKVAEIYHQYWLVRFESLKQA